MLFRSIGVKTRGIQRAHGGEDLLAGFDAYAANRRIGADLAVQTGERQAEKENCEYETSEERIRSRKLSDDETPLEISGFLGAPRAESKIESCRNRHGTPAHTEDKDAARL